MSSLKVSACGLLLIFLVAGRALQAMNMYSYDLDSLVYMSTDVVEATLEKSDNFSERGVSHAEVTAVYKGKLQVAQKVPLVTLEFYAKPGGDGLSGGDKVFLFLEKATSAPFYMDIPANSGIYRTEPSGVKLVQSGRVIGFVQACNPGPYCAGGGLSIQPEQWPSVQEFQDSLAKTVENMNVLAAKFQAKVSPADTSWLMDSIRTRPLRHPKDVLEMINWELDEIARLDCERLAQIHDNKGLAEALTLDLRLFDSFGIFARGFGTQEGVDFLLKATADERQTLEARRRYAKMLEPAAVGYVSGLPQKSGQWAGDYANKVASLAFNERGHEELSKALVDSTGALLSDGSGPEKLRQELDYTRGAFSFQYLGTPIRSQWKGADYSGAFAALRKLHNVTSLESLKYEVELATGAADQSEYKGLKSPCGPIVSIVRLREHPEQFQKPPGRSLLISSRWAVVEDIPVDRCTIVAEYVATGRKYSVDSPLEDGWKDQPGSEDTATVPPDAPKEGVPKRFLLYRVNGAKIDFHHGKESWLGVSWPSKDCEGGEVERACARRSTTVSASRHMTQVS